MKRRAKKLVATFNHASVRRMGEGNATGAPSQPLFHYTSEQQPSVDGTTDREIGYFPCSSAAKSA
jgi:hypothetical protein